MEDLLKRLFLERMSQIESSGGKNTAHRTITSGIHSGDTAYGKYGLMPNTVKELEKRKKLSGQEYNKSILEGNEEEILKALQEKEDEYASQYADLLAKKYQGDQDKMAVGWQFGHNIKNVDKLVKQKEGAQERLRKYQDLVPDLADLKRKEEQQMMQQERKEDQILRSEEKLRRFEELQKLLNK